MPDIGRQLATYFETSTPAVTTSEMQARAALRESARPRMRPVWATLVGFGAAVVLVGGALFAGWLLRNPDAGIDPIAPSSHSPQSATPWWLLAMAGVIGIGIASALVQRARSTRKEIDMQTLDKHHEPDTNRTASQSQRSRGLKVAAALAVVLGAVTIGWLITENRGLSRDLNTGVWPSRGEATALQRQVLEVLGPDGTFYATWNAGDYEAFAALHSAEAIGVDPSFAEHAIHDDTGRSWFEMMYSAGYTDMTPERVWVLQEDAVVLVGSETSFPGPMVYHFDFSVVDGEVRIDLFAMQYAPRAP